MKPNPRRVRQTVSRLIGPISRVSRLPSGNNIVYRVGQAGKDFVVKIYRDRGASRDADVQIVRRFGTFGGVLKKVFAYQQTPIGRLAIQEYIAGQQLSTQMGATNARRYFRQLTDFFAQTAAIKGTRFGRVQENFTGTHPKWLSFVSDHVKFLYNNTPGLADVTGITPLQLQSIAQKTLANRKVESKLIPADVNLTNFVVDAKRNVRAVDIGSWVYGDSAMPFGLLLAHAWGTPLGNQILSSEVFAQNRSAVIFYSLLESISVMSFIKRNKPGLIKTQTPFGNTTKWAEIIRKQKAVLGL